MNHLSIVGTFAARGWVPRNVITWAGRPVRSCLALSLWSVLASYTYGDQATDRPSRSQLASDVGWKSIRSVDTYLAELQAAPGRRTRRRGTGG